MNDASILFLPMHYWYLNSDNLSTEYGILFVTSICLIVDGYEVFCSRMVLELGAVVVSVE